MKWPRHEGVFGRERPWTVAQSVVLLLLALAAPGCATLGGGFQHQISAAKNEVMPALVHVSPVQEVYLLGEREQAAVTGSGVIFDRKGYVLTNEHVARKATRVKCTLYNLEELEAEVVGTDPLTDVAVLKLNLSKYEEPLRAAQLGDSDKVQVGDFVMAMGSPLGYSRSLSLGVVSTNDRYLPEAGPMESPYNIWIQTTAPINPGNSGGPLVNLDGKVVGINSRKVGMGENIGFAIPINLVKEVAAQLIKNGKVARSDIGLHFQETQVLSAATRYEGVLVSQVEEGSPADRAGIKAGDLLIGYDGVPVSARFEHELPKVHKLIADTPVGKSVELVVVRDGKKETFSLKTVEKGKTEGEDFQCPVWGFAVRELTDQIARVAGLKERFGVYVSGVQVGGAGYNAKPSLQAGDVIQFVDGQKVIDLAQFREKYEEIVAGKKKLVLVEVQRGSAFPFIVLKPRYDAQEQPKVATGP